MSNKLNFIITGATAAMLLLPVKTDAQKLELGLRSTIPASVLQKPMRTTPAVLRKQEQKLEDRYPLLFKGTVLRNSFNSGLKELRHGGNISPLSLEPRVPLRTAKTVSGRELWGSVVDDATWGDNGKAYGFYKFNAVSNIAVEALGLNKYICPNGGGAIVGDKLYTVNYTAYPGVIFASLYVFNTETWEREGDIVDLNDYSLIACETATADDGTVYGEFFNSDASAMELGIVDYPNKTRTTIGTLGHQYVALGMTKDNVLYGVAEDGNLYKINTLTAEEKLIGATGVSLMNSEQKYYYQSGEIDQKTGVFYWACVDGAGSSKLYTVDLTTGAAEVVGEFTNNNMIMLLTVPEALADGAPTAATDLTSHFTDGNLNGTISFKLPTTNIKGDNLTGEVSYSISEGADVLASGSGAPGADVTESLTFDTDGLKNIKVSTSNSDGKGEIAKTTMYVGYDTPKGAGNVSLAINEETGDVSLSWDAVTEGVNGGYVGDVKYDVVRYPDKTVVAKGITETSFSDKITSKDFKAYAYGVKAYNDKKTGEEVRSDYKVYGDAINLPYSEGFDSEDAMAYFTIIDNNNDDSKWFYNYTDGNGEARYKYNKNNVGDDWLITPPLKVEKNKVYTVKFKARSYRSSLVEKLEVKYGSSNTVEGMTTELLPATELPGAYTEFTKEITATEDGKLFIGFHAVSEPDQYYLQLDDISVSAGMTASAPAAADNFTVVPAEKGAMSATISFTAPTKAINGADLSDKLSFRIKRGGVVIKELTDVAPGSKQTFVDTTPENGFNSYSITSANADGDGRTTEPVDAYVGIDTPSSPVLNIADNTSSVKVTWTDKEEGENGGYVDTQKTSHKFYTLEDSPYGEIPSLKAKIPVGTNFYDYSFVTNEGEQSLVRFGVTAVNETGEGSVGYTPYMVVGKPYDTPFFESFQGAEQTYDMWWTLKKDFTIGLTLESSDGDGGSFAMRSDANDGTGIIGSGKICLAGTTNPMLIFSHMAETGSNAKLVVSVQKPDGSIEDLKTIDVSADDGGWVRESISLKPELASLPYVIFRFTGTANLGERIYLDEFYVRDIHNSDLTLRNFTAPARIKKGETAKVEVTVSNFGSTPAKEYTVKLYAGDKLVDSKEEKAELAPLASKTYSLDYASSVMEQNDAVELKAEVAYDADMNLDDNTKTASVAFDISNKPCPTNVDATESGDGSVKVSWTAVSPTVAEVEDGFENYDSWTMDKFGEWTGQVGTSTPADAAAGSLFPGIEYPNQGERFAFILADPLTDWITQEILDTEPALMPHGGSKYLASLYKCSNNPNLQDYYDADNWLISPALSGRKQTISFWASNSMTDGFPLPETFEVLYSTEGTDISKFVKIGDSRTLSSGEWEEIKVEIPEGATRFAIHQTTSNETNFLFKIDDIKYESGSGKVTGYNVYRDGTLLKTLDAEKLEFVDNTTEKGKTYVYAVTALFADGESEATLATAITTDIESIENVLKASSYDVYTIDGKLVGTGLSTLKNLKAGSYIINDQKVIIR